MFFMWFICQSISSLSLPLCLRVCLGFYLSLFATLVNTFFIIFPWHKKTYKILGNSNDFMPPFSVHFISVFFCWLVCVKIQLQEADALLLKAFIIYATGALYFLVFVYFFYFFAQWCIQDAAKIGTYICLVFFWGIFFAASLCAAYIITGLVQVWFWLAFYGSLLVVFNWIGIQTDRRVLNVVAQT